MNNGPKLDLGDRTIHWLFGGQNSLDGGAMFGAVPKMLWNKKCEVDADNCFEMVNNPLLVQTPEAKVLIDTGFGNKFIEKQEKIFRVNKPWAVVDELARFGLDRKSIDYVILTHGDFDHAGGAVLEREDGSLEPTYPNARYIIQKKEWQDITAPIERTKHTYFADNFAVLKEANLLEIVDGEHEVSPGITVRHSGGHTRGHQIVIMEGESGSAVHMGDLFPTRFHANPLWVMAYDNFPLDVIERKKQFFGEYWQKSWFTFYHDKEVRACRLDGSDGRYKVIESIG